MTRTICLLVAALAMLGCGAKDEAKRYPMQGEVKALDPASKSATIAAGQVGPMEPMTMDYIVKPDAEFAKLHVGDHIQATVVMKDPMFYVTDVKVTPK